MVLYGCLLCPRDDEGYVGFEGETLAAFRVHAMQAHGITEADFRAAKSQHGGYICGGTLSRSWHMFELPDGRPLFERAEFPNL